MVTWWNETAYEDGQFTIEGLLSGIVDALANIGTWINDHIFKPFIDGFKNAFGIHSPSTVMQEQGGFIIEGLLNGICSAWQRVTAFFQPAVEGIKQIFNGLNTFFQGVFAGNWSQVWSGIVGIAKGAINGVIGVVNNLISAVTNGINALFRLLSFNIPLPFGGSIGLSLPQVSAPQIPYLAKGAVIPPNAPFAAVLGDQRHGNNIEAPEDLIRRIVREETAGRGDDQLAALLEELIAVVGNIQIGDDVIGRAAQRYARHSERARGW